MRAPSWLRLGVIPTIAPFLLARLHSGELDFVLFDDDLWIVGRREDRQLKSARVVVTTALADRLLARSLARPCPSRTIALAARRSTSRLADLQALAAVLRDSN